MRKCRNWQTSKTKDLVIIAIVWVQVPSSAFKVKHMLLFHLFSLSGNSTEALCGMEQKRTYISEQMENQTVQLVISMAVAVLSMLFVNVTIGAMGGLPLWAGILISFYVIRTNALRGRKNPGGWEETDVRKTMAVYGVLSFVIWAVMKIILTAAQLVGWGSVSTMTVKEYFNSIYGSTLVERWAYVFAAILVLSFVMSLFPLTLIHRKSCFFAYAGLDAALFCIVTWVVRAICDIWIDKQGRSKIHSVMDALFLCVTPHKWQAGLFLSGAVVFFVLVTAGAYITAKYRKLYHKEQKEKRNEDAGKTLTPEERMRQEKEERKLTAAGIVAAIVLVAATAAFILFLSGSQKKQETSYTKAAEALTEDFAFGPMAYGETVYIPVQTALSCHETKEPLGYFANKGENVDSRFYALSVGNLLYPCDDAKSPDYLEEYGKDFNSYKRADLLEQENAWENDSLFVLWDEEWMSETAYSKDRTGYSICERGFVDQLEQKFKKVTYRAGDFADYDAYFTISGYAGPKQAFGDEVKCGDWVGCILVKDNQFYYGNYDNVITGDLEKELLSVLGGNEQPQTENTEETERDF